MYHAGSRESEGRSVDGQNGWVGSLYAANPGEWEERPSADSELLRVAQSGDRAALQQLLGRHERSLFVLCRGILAHADDAEDAAQETFLRAIRALPRFQPREATFRTWLFRIAINVCLNHKRDRRTAAPLDEELSDISSRIASPETIALHRLLVTEALAILPPHQRAVLLLRVVEGWSVGEIARAMDWNKKRVENELYRARRALAEWQARSTEEGG
jgi:RNA polymerase sigma-70 factor (ECF subfamily)